MLRLMKTESGQSRRSTNPKSVKLKNKHHARHIPN